MTGTVVGLAILAHTINIPQAIASLSRADPLWIAAALGLTMLAVAASVVEWGVLLRTAGPRQRCRWPHALLSWRRLSSSYLQSLFFTQMLPAGVGGDAMRTVEMGRQVGHGRVLASLAGSRMAGMLGMTCWGIAAAVILRALLGTGRDRASPRWRSVWCSSGYARSAPIGSSRTACSPGSRPR